MPNLPIDNTFWITIFVLIISLVVCMGGLYALVKQKIVVNEKHEITSVELPVIGKIKTNYPSLAAVFLGIALAFIVYFRWPIPGEQHEKMPLVATIQISSSDRTMRDTLPRNVYIGAIPLRYHRFENGVLLNEPKELTLHVDDSGPYHAFAYTPTNISDDGRTEHVVDHGSVEIHDDPKLGRHGTFSANLRID